MATITFKGNPIETSGELPPVGSVAPDFTVTSLELADVTLASLGAQKKILNIFPSIDTGVCAKSVRQFNIEATQHPDVLVLNISADLPFAHKRFCGAEGIDRAKGGSTFRSSFSDDYGVTIKNGPLAGLTSRAVVVLDADNKVIYTEQVPEIAQEPNYEAAIKSLG